MDAERGRSRDRRSAGRPCPRPRHAPLPPHRVPTGQIPKMTGTNDEEGAVSFETLLYDTDGPVATITLNRPDRLNTIVPPMPEEFESAIRAATVDRSVKVIVVRGAGRSFCAGYDFAGGFHHWDEMLTTDGGWDPGKDFALAASRRGRLPYRAAPAARSRHHRGQVPGPQGTGPASRRLPCRLHTGHPRRPHRGRRAPDRRTAAHRHPRLPGSLHPPLLNGRGAHRNR